MTPTQRLAGILNSVFHLRRSVGDFPSESTRNLFSHVELLSDLDCNLRLMHQQNHARRAVSMCLVFMARHRLASKYPNIRDIYWQQWTQRFRPEMRDITLFEDFDNRVGGIMEAMTQQAVTEQRALMFALVA